MNREVDIDELYEEFKTSVNKATEETVGLRKRTFVDGLTQREVELCHRRREARKEMLKDPSSLEKRAVYSELNKDVKRTVKQTKRRNLENKVHSLEEQYLKNDSHNLFKSVKDLEEKPRKQLSAIKDGNGQKHFQSSKILKLWEDHFKNHLNTSFPHDEKAIDSIEPIPLNLNNHIPDITEEEITKAITKMKTRKAPGTDEITIEVIKAGGEKMIDMLLKVFGTILAFEKTPIDFSKMIVCPVYKKGDKFLMSNYRAIALLSIPGKIFLKILLERMKEIVERKLKESQYGFRSGRGTVDAIFVIRMIIEKAKEKNLPLHFNFIDFQSAFDTVWRNALWKMLLKIGVPTKYVNIIKFMYENTKCDVTIENTLTGWFSVGVGVRQGCILSPTLFNVFLEFIMDEITSTKDFQLTKDLMIDVRYADDTTLVSTTLAKLGFATQELEVACKKWGLKINAKKYKIMSLDPACSIEIEEEKVDVVENFVFLGSLVPSTTDDIKRRIALASSAFGRLKKTVWSNRNVSNQLKLRLYNALILPIAIYACECWTLKAEDSRRLSVFENDCFRSMIGKTRLDRYRLVDIRRILGVRDNITNMVKKRRLNWFGHVNRREDTSMVKKAYKEEFQGKRPRGRPKKRWVDQIREDFRTPLLTIERRTRDRDKWKESVTRECARTR